MTEPQPDLHLRPMRADELAAFRESFIRDWAADLARIDDVPAAEALRQAAQRTDAELSAGVATRGHHLFVLVAGDEAVGTAWLSVTATGEAFLDDQHRLLAGAEGPDLFWHQRVGDVET